MASFVHCTWGQKYTVHYSCSQKRYITNSSWFISLQKCRILGGSCAWFEMSEVILECLIYSRHDPTLWHFSFRYDVLRTYLVLFVSDMPFFHHWAIEAAMFKGLRELQLWRCLNEVPARKTALWHYEKTTQLSEFGVCWIDYFNHCANKNPSIASSSRRTLHFLYMFMD